MTLARFERRPCGTTPACLQRGEIDRVALELVADRRQPHLGRVALGERDEAALRQAPLQRHLAALEADLVVAAGARLLALVAAAGGLAEARCRCRGRRACARAWRRLPA